MSAKTPLHPCLGILAKDGSGWFRAPHAAWSFRQHPQDTRMNRLRTFTMSSTCPGKRDNNCETTWSLETCYSNSKPSNLSILFFWKGAMTSWNPAVFRSCPQAPHTPPQHMLPVPEFGQRFCFRTPDRTSHFFPGSKERSRPWSKARSKKQAKQAAKPASKQEAQTK